MQAEGQKKAEQNKSEKNENKKTMLERELIKGFRQEKKKGKGWRLPEVNAISNVREMSIIRLT